LRKEFLLLVVVCICVGLLVTPCLAAKHTQVKIDNITGKYHAGDTLVISGKTKNLPDGTAIEIYLKNPQHAVVNPLTSVKNNRYTVTIPVDYLGAGTWTVFAGTPFAEEGVSLAFSKTRSFRILP
jgi:acylphosphatase